MPLSTNAAKPHAVMTNGDSFHVTTNGTTACAVSETIPLPQRMTDVTVVKERLSGLYLKFRKELHVSDGKSLVQVESVEDFLEFIDTERLRRIPRQGSGWDRVLKWAEYFAGLVAAYQESVGEFVLQSEEAAKVVWSLCQKLLLLGPSHVIALEKAFGVFFKLGLSLSSFLRHRNLFLGSSHVQFALGQTYTELLTLVADIAIYYLRRNQDILATKITVEYDALFGRTVDSFLLRKDQAADAILSYQLQQTLGAKNVTLDVRTIREWLSPRDRVTNILTSDRLGTRGARDEYTCEWFEKHLLHFTRSSNDILHITGNPGCGKSVLFGWILERFQRPLDRKDFDIISHKVEADISGEATSLRLVKGLISELLQQSVNNTALYKSLVTAFELSTGSRNPDEIEDALWEAFDAGLGFFEKTSNNTVIVIDGLESLTGGGTTASRLMANLQTRTEKHQYLKAIVLSQPFTDKLPCKSERLCTIDIKSLLVDDDICQLVRRSLESFRPYSDQASGDRENIIKKIVQKVEGSFIYAELWLEVLKRDKTFDGFKAYLEKAPLAISDLIQKLLSCLDLTKPETKMILSWLIVAERPLTLMEINALLETDAKSVTVLSRTIQAEEEIRFKLSSLVSVRDNIVRFRHPIIRTRLLQLASQGVVMSLNEALLDLTIRSLAYVKIHLSYPGEPSLEPLEWPMVQELFQKHCLLEYAARYWSIHLRRSTMHKASGSLDLSPNFKSAFPGSTLFASVEAACWETQTLTIDAVNLHLLALTTRQTVLGERSKCVLQSQITIAHTYQKLSMMVEASTFYYKTVRLSQMILDKFSTFTSGCATRYLACTTTVTTTTRTEVTNQREEVLKCLIITEKHRHGATSETVIQYNKILAQLYVDIQEIQSAASIYREIYKACVERYGQFSDEASVILRSLKIVGRMESEREDVLQRFCEVVLMAERTMTVIDIRRITATIRMAEIYESLKEIVKAEEIYVTLWRRVIGVCIAERTTVCFERKIEVTMHYVRFLRRNYRHTEAESILRGLWAEFEYEVITSEIIIIGLKGVGEELKAMGILEVAQAVFTYVWDFFKRTNRQVSSDAVSTVILLLEISQSTHTHTSVTVYESVLTEIFETTITTTTTKVDVATVTVCHTLSTYYARHDRWHDAVKVCKQLLQRLWPSVCDDRPGVALPEGLALESIQFARHLASYYLKSGHAKESEKIRIRIFQAAKSSLRIQETLVIETCRELVSFYQSLNQIEKAIEVYRGLIKDCRSALGSSHAVTVKTLYELGSFCTKHGHNDASQFYHEIVISLNQGSEYCHLDAMEAAMILAASYYEKKKWSEAQKVYKILWHTFVKRGKEYNMTIEVVSIIYDKYSHILEKETKVELSVLRKLTLEYKDTCSRVFGVRAEITLRATFRLAEICERSEAHKDEAISIYEEAIKVTKKTTTTVTITTVLTKAKQRLVQLYVTHTSSSSSYSEKALSLAWEHFEDVKTQHGCSHTTTLTTLRELVVLCKRQNSEQLTFSAWKALQDCTVGIIKSETDSKRLFDSSILIAGIYTQCGYREQGLALLRELRRQIIARDAKANDRFKFHFEQSVGRLSYGFLVGFEETLNSSKKINFSEIMADSLTETLLYEHYRRSIKQKTSFDLLLQHGAQLHSFLASRKRLDQVTVLDSELYEAFHRHLEQVSVKANSRTTQTLYRILLGELGQDRPDVSFNTAVCTAGNNQVFVLLGQGKFQEAYELAVCVYQFANHFHFFRDFENFKYGFNLSLHLASLGAKVCEDAKLRTQMMDLSSVILKEILDSCKKTQFDFAQMEIKELNSVAVLLGEQRKFDDLEWLLTRLWSSRHAQSKWSSRTIVGIGRSLVEVRFSHTNKRDAAIQLCETICYNLRRASGPLDSLTLEMSNLLAQLYTTLGRYHDASAVHERILHQIVTEQREGTIDKAIDKDITNAPQLALAHWHVLKRCHQRAGGWDNKDPGPIKELHGQLKDKDVYGGEKIWTEESGVDGWNLKGGKVSGGEKDGFTAPSTWGFWEPPKELKKQQSFRTREMFRSFGPLTPRTPQHKVQIVN